MELKDKLKELRETHGYMQKDVADDLKIAPNTLSGYERGLRNPDSETLKKMANYYGVTVDYLLGSQNTINDLELEIPEGVTILRRMKNMSPSARKKMLQIMKTLIDEELRDTHN